MGLIYKITNTINNKCYIGQTIQTLPERKGEHVYRYRRMERDHRIYLAFKKYGLRTFKWDVIEEVPNSQLDDREIFWISKYDSFSNGYNCNPGGNSLGPETIEKIRKAMTGRKVTWAYKAAATIRANGGYVMTEAKKEKITGKNNPKAKKYIVTEPNGTEHFVHGLRQWCRAWTKDRLNHGELSRCATGEYKQHHGYSCRYATDFEQPSTTIRGRSTLQAIGSGNGEGLSTERS